MSVERQAQDRERLRRVNDPGLYAAYPESAQRQAVRATVARELIPAEQLRKARAAGFDSDHVYYHGTKSPWTSGVPDSTRRNWVEMEWGDGLYLSDSPGMALRYARDDMNEPERLSETATLMAFVLRNDAQIFQFGQDYFERGRRNRLADPTGVTAVLKSQGYDGAWNPTRTQLVIWNSEKLRHVGANFADLQSADVFA